jgi:hypothetical protein
VGVDETRELLDLAWRGNRLASLPALAAASGASELLTERKGHLDGPAAEEHSGGTTQTPLDACAAIAMQRGSTRALREDGHAPEQERIPEPPPNQGAVEHDGFNLHASVAVAADDDVGRERLCRYGARPPLALDRLRRLPDGRVAYRIKAQRDGRAKYRVMTPLEFLARLAALVPPPRYPLVRFHGVLAPRSSWRRDVVPRPRAPIACAPARRSRPAAAHCSARATKPAPEAFANAASSWATAPTSPSAGRRSTKTTRPRAELERPVGAASVEHQADAADCSPPPGAPIVLAPNVLAVEHWNRLFGGLLYAATPRLDWAALLRRSFEVDVLACKQCGGRLRVLGAVTDPAMVRLMLESLGMPTEAPRAARARDPTELLGNPEADR